MRTLGLALLAAACALVLTGQAGALDPPNPNDPCSSAGRDTCGTTGIGYWRTYRYGIRWFGDYKGVLPGGGRGFCIDLGYWYPKSDYRYMLDDTQTLADSAGRTVPLVNRQKMAYAAWTYGRTTDPNRQAAVMLYVHSLMGDARPGEVDPAALGPRVESIYRTVADGARRLHGPYRIVGQVPGPLKAGEAATATVRVLAASGAAVPGATLSLSAEGASGVPGTVTADDHGVARITFRPTASAQVTIGVTARALASTLPSVYRATVAKAAPNAQRLIAPTSQEIKGTVTQKVTKTHITVSTTATPTQLVAGHVVRDRVVISGATSGWTAQVTASIHGPFPSETEITCGKTVWQGTFDAHGPGTYTTPKTSVHETGWYVFQLTVPGDDTNVGLKTGCDEEAERFFVQAQPTLSTTVSADSLTPGGALFDRVKVGALAGTTVTVTVDLYGPFPTQEAISCTTAPVWSGAVTAKANGTYRTDSFTVTVPGFYTYVAGIQSTQVVRGSQGSCGEEAETTFVEASPKVTTRASAAVTRPGSEILDQLVVTGAGAVTLPVTIELFGPFSTRAAIRCTGTPLWTGKVTAKGDGTYLSGRVTVPVAGYYVFRESIAATPQSTAFTGKCPETSETTLASATPSLTTQVASDVVRPGAALSDEIAVSGLGKTEAAIQVQLFGPFASRAQISCSGKPYSQTLVTAHGDGTLRSPPVKIASAGFYTFRETLIARDNVAQVETPCGDTAETALGAPAIITGRGDRTQLIAARAVGESPPTRIRIASLGIDAPVAASVIDVKQGVLAVPADIHKTAWWADGSAPGDPHGAVVIAGHVDSAVAGAGAFFSLKSVRKGAIVEVDVAGVGTKVYRVTSVKTMPKAELPTDIWSQKGRSRLVLVTCGGPFDTATRHYRDNVVVTAVPA